MVQTKKPAKQKVKINSTTKTTQKTIEATTTFYCKSKPFTYHGKDELARATVSSMFSSDFSLKNMFDDDNSSKWRSSIQDRKPLIKIIFKELSTITKIEIVKTDYDYTDLCFRESVTF